MDIKGEIYRNTVKVGDFNTPLTSTDRSSQQKINKEIMSLNDTIDQMGLINIFRTFHPKTSEYRYFSSAHGTVSRADHMLENKTHLNKFKKIAIISSIFSDHNTMKLESIKGRTLKPRKTRELNNMLLNNEWVSNEIKKEITRYLETNGDKNTTIQNLWDTLGKQS